MAEHNDAPDMRRLISDLGAQMAAALTVPVSRPPSEGAAFRGVAVLGMAAAGAAAAARIELLLLLLLLQLWLRLLLLGGCVGGF